MTIVFMGTPEFAAKHLEALLQSRHRIAAVYTQPDKPRGRSGKPQPPPVKVLAEENGVPVFQPDSFSEPEVLRLLAGHGAELIVVVAYGKLLPEAVLGLPKYGCINLHGSLLPRYRGAAPVQWSIMQGEEVTGATVMYLAKRLDAGDVIASRPLPIGPDDTTADVKDRLAVMGSGLLLDVIDRIEAGESERVPQDETLATWAPAIDKSMTALDFRLPAQAVHDKVRALNPAPCARATADGVEVKIIRTALSDGQGEAGEVIPGKRLVVACGEGAVEILEIQRAGKRAVSGREYILGSHPKRFS